MQEGQQNIRFNFLPGSIGIEADNGCKIPSVIRGSWFSLEQGQVTSTNFNANSMSRRGYCMDMKKEQVNYTFVFHSEQCFYCVRILVRTVNVLEKIESK